MALSINRFNCTFQVQFEYTLSDIKNLKNGADVFRPLYIASLLDSYTKMTSTVQWLRGNHYEKKNKL